MTCQNPNGYLTDTYEKCPGMESLAVSHVTWSCHFAINRMCVHHVLGSIQHVQCRQYTYRQPLKNNSVSHFPQVTWFWFVTFNKSFWMLQTKTSHLWKVTYAIILLGWRYAAHLVLCSNLSFTIVWFWSRSFSVSAFYCCKLGNCLLG